MFSVVRLPQLVHGIVWYSILVYVTETHETNVIIMVVKIRADGRRAEAGHSTDDICENMAMAGKLCLPNFPIECCLCPLLQSSVFCPLFRVPFTALIIYRLDVVFRRSMITSSGNVQERRLSVGVSSSQLIA